MGNKTLYATLIGINAYENANSLNGCVKDILNFDKVLRTLAQDQTGDLDYKPLHFLSPKPVDEKIIALYKKNENIQLDYLAPTFRNISEKAFQHLSNANANDICIFYYSGHGSYLDAPKEFWERNNTRVNQTLVCCDSRSSARDLVDKEIGYLLYKALKDKPDVHCVVIMDCCHSGSNTRSLTNEKSQVCFRQESPSNQNLTIQDYLGFKEGYYNIDSNGNANPESANYISLSACRDNEKALDSYTGGLFSETFAGYLSNGGRKESYRNIIQNLSSTIAKRNGAQNPVAFPDDKIDQPFLGGKLVPYVPGYEVRYLSGSEIWQLQAGALQGIVPSSGNQKTIVNILPLNIEAEVTDVQEYTATLKVQDINKLDKENSFYKATVQQLAIKKLVIGISEFLKAEPGSVALLKKAFDPVKHKYIELDIEGGKAQEYLINIGEIDKEMLFYLTQAVNDVPVFKAEADPLSFLNNVDAVGQWLYVKDLKNGNSIFTSEDFIFTIEKIEGQANDLAKRDTTRGDAETIKPGKQIDLQYKGEYSPMLRFSIKLNPNSTIKECYVQAIYFDSLFGIYTGFIEPDVSRLTPTGEVKLKLRLKGREYDLIQFILDKEYQVYNINEIVEHLKIIVSDQPNIQIQGFKQDSLELELRKINKTTRGIEKEADHKTISGWAAFDFTLRIIGPQKQKQIKPGGNTDFPTFTITAPTGFSATAIAVTQADTGETGRGIIESAPNLWGDEMTEDLPFGDEFGKHSGKGTIALEIALEDNKKIPEISANNPLIITPKTSGLTRDIESHHTAVTIPYGYDDNSKLYFPVGHQDETGKIYITTLPSPTAETLVSGAIHTRSIFGSIKLYFKKLFKKPTNTLTLHTYKEGKWTAVTEMSEIQSSLKAGKLKELPFIIHGIFGDTRSIVEGLKLDESLAENFPVMLSYDYENLSTTISDTAKQLITIFDKLGVDDADVPKLTIIAHSMGGLVSRCCIEKTGGDKYVKKLIMAGTPNAGSEWSAAGDKIIKGAGFLLSHAMNSIGPIKHVISGIGFLLKKFHNPQTALNDMGLDAAFIKELNESEAAAQVAYYLVGSDTNLYREYNGEDYFLSKVKFWLMDKVVFPGLDQTLFNKQPNDMAVTVESMKKIKGFDAETKVQILPGDHISYFTDELTRKAIVDLAKK